LTKIQKKAFSKDNCNAIGRGRNNTSVSYKLIHSIVPNQSDRQPDRQADRPEERKGEERRNEAGTTLNSVNRKVQSEIKKTAATKNCH